MCKKGEVRVWKIERKCNPSTESCANYGVTVLKGQRPLPQRETQSLATSPRLVYLDRMQIQILLPRTVKLAWQPGPCRNYDSEMH